MKQREKVKRLLNESISDYNKVVRNISDEATAQSERAYGGMVRQRKGKMVEKVSEKLLRAAWLSLGKDTTRLEFNLHPKYEIQIRPEYVGKITDDDLRSEIQENIGKYKIQHGTDIHVYIDKNFILSVECKAFTESAMLKRILFDAFLLGTRFPNLRFVLIQLESQLGGDYGSANPGTATGSHQSHTLMSYMDLVDLNIITLLEGDRKVKEPIHDKKFFKEMKRERLESAVVVLAELLSGEGSASVSAK